MWLLYPPINSRIKCNYSSMNCAHPCCQRFNILVQEQCGWSHTIYCEVEKFGGFHRLIGNCESFPVKLMVWPHDTAMQHCNCECFPANYSWVLQPQNFSTSNNLQYTVNQRLTKSQCSCIWLCTLLSKN